MTGPSERLPDCRDGHLGPALGEDRSHQLARVRLVVDDEDPEAVELRKSTGRNGAGWNPEGLRLAGGTFVRKATHEVPDTINAVLEYPEGFVVNLSSTFNNESSAESGLLVCTWPNAVTARMTHARITLHVLAAFDMGAALKPRTGSSERGSPETIADP